MSIIGAWCSDVPYKGTGGQSNFRDMLAIAAHLNSIVGLQVSGLSEKKSFSVLQCCESLNDCNN